MTNLEFGTAVPADISELATLHVAAFRRDLAVNLMFHSEAQQHNEIVQMVLKQVLDPKVLVIKAFDPSTKETVGLAIWLLYDGTEKSVPISDVTASAMKGKRSITDAISGEARRIQSYWMTGKKYMRQSF
ncbi:hypothetical protein MMC14_004594 [Varicellaria rhodocarpa]|nr:hypothetical protein [Varicellaria rhodocarpa]